MIIMAMLGMPAESEQWCLPQCLVSSSDSGEYCLGELHEPGHRPSPLASHFPAPASGVVTFIGQLVPLDRWLVLSLGNQLLSPLQILCPGIKANQLWLTLIYNFSSVNLAENWAFRDQLIISSDSPASRVVLSVGRAVWRLEVILIISINISYGSGINCFKNTYSC